MNQSNNNNNNITKNVYNIICINELVITKVTELVFTIPGVKLNHAKPQWSLS